MPAVAFVEQLPAFWRLRATAGRRRGRPLQIPPARVAWSNCCHAVWLCTIASGSGNGRPVMNATSAQAKRHLRCSIAIKKNLASASKRRGTGDDDRVVHSCHVGRRRVPPHASSSRHYPGSRCPSLPFTASSARLLLWRLPPSPPLRPGGCSAKYDQDFFDLRPRAMAEPARFLKLSMPPGRWKKPRSGSRTSTSASDGTGHRLRRPGGRERARVRGSHACPG